MEISPPVKFDDTETAFRYKSDSELRKANFIFTVVNNPIISSLATGSVKLGMALRLPIKGLVKKTVFNHFCGGETIESAEKTIQHLGEFQVNAILDYSVEGEKTEAGFDKTTEEILHTFDKAKSSSHIPFCVFKLTGLAATDLLAKVQAVEKLTVEEDLAYGKVRQRVERICEKAYRLGIPVLVDAEETWIQKPIDDIAYEMMAKYNRDKAIVFNTIQMYCVAGLSNLKDALAKATQQNHFLGVKLVRGAYIEKERTRAADMNYADPIQPDKNATDNSFNEALTFCMEHKDRMAVVCGSHNEHSNQYLAALMAKAGMTPGDCRVWFAQLLGMSDNISFNLSRAGYNVAKYVPYGPVGAVMPYLLRRASENTSVAGQSSRELGLIRKELARRKKQRA